MKPFFLNFNCINCEVIGNPLQSLTDRVPFFSFVLGLVFVTETKWFFSFFFIGNELSRSTYLTGGGPSVREEGWKEGGKR